MDVAMQHCSDPYRRGWPSGGRRSAPKSHKERPHACQRLAVDDRAVNVPVTGNTWKAWFLFSVSFSHMSAWRAGCVSWQYDAAGGQIPSCGWQRSYENKRPDKEDAI